MRLVVLFVFIMLQTLRWFYNFDSGVGGNPISAQLVALPMINRAR